ncbi:MAG TPA: peptide chain release factor N(5)-glutamine methyltransferase [Candidatus Binataceae bacterium]|nr:peptide chain release factor N(5)-glutamine methyltransferase [Candidatus Binataceae bacterium]
MEPDRPNFRKLAAGLLAEASERMRQAGVESPALDAELLLAAAAGVDRTRLLSGSLALDDRSIGRFDQFVSRRAAREPLAYIMGNKEFHGIEFEVNREVLIPRPETELVVDAAAAFLSNWPSSRVLDLGSGSGAIAIAIAVELPTAIVTATDISASALEVARRNAKRHGCSHRIEFLLGDCFAAIPCSHPKFDLILSNPPYVRDLEIDGLQPEVACYEPEIALRGGQDGLDFYRRIAAEVGAYLSSGGEVIVEVGAGQAVQVARILEGGGCRVAEKIRDLSGHQRVVRARRPA